MNTTKAAPVALVTCVTLPEPDPDADFLINGLRDAGITAEYVAWDDPTADWSRFPVAVIRSPWNYYEDESAFRAWIDLASESTLILNPPDILRGNLHKRYLLGFERVGVPIVPTESIERGGLEDPISVARTRGWDRFVIKPAVSAGSFMTEAFSIDQGEEARTFLTGIVSHRDAMIQQFMESVVDGGEINLIHIAGELTHGIVKRPRFSADEESVSDAVQPDAKQRDLARTVMEHVPSNCLYARVDLMRQGDSWLLSELELIEPSLFFLQYPPALNRFSGELGKILERTSQRV